MAEASDLLTLYTRLATLKLLPRAGWLQRGVAQPESVAEHTAMLRQKGFRPAQKPPWAR